jgi:hypothetical protein
VIDGQYILDTIIKKAMFNDSIPIELKENGVLFYPNIHMQKNNQFVISYSLSVPLTDVGWAVVIKGIPDEERKKIKLSVGLPHGSED